LLQVVSGSDDHMIIVWDAHKGDVHHSVTFRSAVMSLAWHPEEVSKLMIGEKNGVVHIFNIISYHVRAIFSMRLKSR
jgi:WD40 repeat protein